MSDVPVAPSIGRTVHYLDDGTPFLAFKDGDIEGVCMRGDSVIDLADGAPAYDEANMYKDLFHHWPEETP